VVSGFATCDAKAAFPVIQRSSGGIEGSAPEQAASVERRHACASVYKQQRIALVLNVLSWSRSRLPLLDQTSTLLRGGRAPGSTRERSGVWACWRGLGFPSNAGARPHDPVAHRRRREGARRYSLSHHAPWPAEGPESRHPWARKSAHALLPVFMSTASESTFRWSRAPLDIQQMPSDPGSVSLDRLQ
jgi:hypothetical protein